MPKNAQEFICEDCDFKCCKKSNYDIHLATQKHINTINYNEKNAKSYLCECGKMYNYNASLYNHKKKCKNLINENIVVKDASSNEIKVLTTLVLEIVKSNTELQKQSQEVMKSNTELQKQNHDLQKQVLDVCKNIQPSSSITNSNNTNINSHNKTFNLQFFLNEQCKDAMNINDFIKSIKIEISDLERLGKEGYVEGFSRIILEKLKEMNIYKRPLHCSDAKRETMYIKENDVWNKDESSNNEKMIEFIKAVEQRNYTSLLAYADAYPEVYKQESKLNVPYLHMALQSNGTAERINKVMKRIIKEVIINKDN